MGEKRKPECRNYKSKRFVTASLRLFLLIPFFVKFKSLRKQDKRLIKVSIQMLSQDTWRTQSSADLLTPVSPAF